MEEVTTDGGSPAPKREIISTNLLDYIVKFDNVIPVDLCETIIEELSKDGWARHKMYDDFGNAVELKKHENFSRYGCQQHMYSYLNADREPCIVAREIIMNMLDNTAEKWHQLPLVKALQANPPNQKISQPRFNRYEEGECMPKHTDFIISGIGLSYLSMLFALNDSTEYEGGDFVICEDYVVNDFNTGDILVFPSWIAYPHLVTPVTKGTRYTAVSWIYLTGLGMAGPEPSYYKLRDDRVNPFI